MKYRILILALVIFGLANTLSTLAYTQELPSTCAIELNEDQGRGFNYSVGFGSTGSVFRGDKFARATDIFNAVQIFEDYIQSGICTKEPAESLKTCKIAKSSTYDSWQIELGGNRLFRGLVFVKDLSIEEGKRTIDFLKLHQICR